MWLYRRLLLATAFCFLMYDLPDVCFSSPFNDSGLFWQKEWGKESITIDKGYCIKGWSCWYGWSCLCGPLQYDATWWRPSGLCIYLTCSLLPRILKKKIMEILKCSPFSVTSWICLIGSVNMWHFVDSCCPYKHTSLHLELHDIFFSGWILCKRNVPCSLWMLGDELHCKQAFQGQCGKSKINWMAVRCYA